jgi:hypothetical protein
VDIDFRDLLEASRAALLGHVKPSEVCTSTTGAASTPAVADIKAAVEAMKRLLPARPRPEAVVCLRRHWEAMCREFKVDPPGRGASFGSPVPVLYGVEVYVEETPLAAKARAIQLGMDGYKVHLCVDEEPTP